MSRIGKTLIFFFCLALMSAFFMVNQAAARSSFPGAFYGQYGVNISCDYCHPNNNTSQFNPYSTDLRSEYLSNGGVILDAFTAVEPLDSDGDSFTNIQEILAGTLPGDASSFPQGDTTPPTVNITSPAIGGVYHINSLPLSYTVSDGTIQVSLDGKVIPNSASSLNGLANGSHTLLVESTDAANNVGNSQVTFTVDVEPMSLAGLPDMNGSGTGEVAALLKDNAAGGNATIVKDGSTQEWIRKVPFPSAYVPLDLAVVPNLGGGSDAELAELGVDGSGNVRVNIKDPGTMAWVGAVDFPARFVPQALAVVPDINGNSASELAVLGIDASNNVRVNIKDAATGAWVGAIDFPSTFTPKGLAVIPDVNGNGVAELAVLGVDASGNVRANIKDATTGAWVGAVDFPSSFAPQGFAAVGNGTFGLAVLGVDFSGNVRVSIKAADTGAWIGAMDFPSTFTPQALAAIPDVNGNGSAELAVLGMENTGSLRVEIKDTATGAWVQAMPLPPRVVN